MKTQRTSASKRGFTLMELMVAMAITTIIVTVLVSITSIALDTWNRSRSELRAARQAKSMIDTMARDFESLVTRKGNTSEWLSVAVESPTDIDDLGENIKSTNASKLIFFTAATDRYDGKIGTDDDNGGDVSCVAYQLKYRDPIDESGTVKTFILNRLLVNPDDTFEDLLGKTDSTKPAESLDKVFAGTKYETDLSKPENFVCENVFQFSVTFHVQVTIPGVAPASAKVVNVPVPINSNGSDKTFEKFAIQGTGLKVYKNKNNEPVAGDTVDVGGTSVTLGQLASGRITAVEIAITVLSDSGVEQQKRRSFGSDADKAAFMAKNSYEYSKLVPLSSM